MLQVFAANFINYFVIVFNVLILARVLMSWVPEAAEWRIGRFVFDVTEPILGPIRRILPQSQFLDFSPLVAFLILQLLGQFAITALQG